MFLSTRKITKEINQMNSPKLIRIGKKDNTNYFYFMIENGHIIKSKFLSFY